MTPAYIHLIRYAINKRLSLSVHDGNSWLIRDWLDEAPILEAMQLARETVLIIKRRGSALVNVLLADEKTVVEHTDNKFFAGWLAAYKREKEEQ